MTHNNLRLAIYGKGGIGKSTIAANLSAAFAAMGKSVLQIGCDPKHDSTRLLLGGRTVETVLEHLEDPMNQADMIRFRRNLMSPDRTAAEVLAAGRGVPEGLQRQNVLHEGFGGVLCIEAGGPRPGVGCAGRGIITTFELLQKLQVDPDEFDVVLYDVLGDVVCGGFGVPLRHEHANAILLITSEEYMPIYAANNILRGVSSYDRHERRLAGLFLNRRDNDASREIVQRFSAATELPIVAALPRSPIVQKADRQGRTLAEAFADSEEATVFCRLAEELIDHASPRYTARPMTDAELEQAVLGREVAVENPDAHPTRPAGKTKRVTTGEPHRLAVYGKGGIGKSTVAANISAALASRGLRVLQIGCDPKHDSTRLLLSVRTVRTVLEYLRDVSESDQQLDDVVHEGLLGIHCVEVGGPEPGVGCAGRGILSAFTLLEKLGLREYDYDAIVYDVLGDVVCGGFAIPMRKGYAQSILLVTSEEYMPIYAANNILRGLNGVAGVVPKLLGIFHNVRDNDADFGSVERFAQAAGLPIVSRLLRSPVVQEAEHHSLPLNLHSSRSAEAEVFNSLAGNLLNDPTHYPAAVMTDARLDEIVLGQATPTVADENTEALEFNTGLDEASAFTQAVTDLRFCNFEQTPNEPYYYRQKPIRQPIWGCAFQSAVRTALRLRDAVVVAHSPRSCSYICRAGICAGASQNLKLRNKFEADVMSPNLVCTDMTVPHMIYGGTELLAETLKQVLLEKPPVVFLATACPPAIIGDDIVEAIRQAQPVSPNTRIIPLRTDGNMTGGGMNGHLSALFDGLLNVVDAAQNTTVDPRSVNLIGDWSCETSRQIRQVLADVGLSVNTSFSVDDRSARVEDLRRLNGAPLTLMSSYNPNLAATAKHLRERFGTELCSQPFPKGFRETALWLREIGEFFGIEQRVEDYLARQKADYERVIVPCRQALAGKRVVLFYWGLPVDWILDVMLDCGIEVKFVGIMVREKDLRYSFRHRGKVPVEFGFHPERRREIVESIRPDAVFTDFRHSLPHDTVVLDTAGLTMDDVTFGPDRKLAQRWARLIGLHVREKWRDDFVPWGKRSSPAGSSDERRTA